MKRIFCLVGCLVFGSVNAASIDFNSNPDGSYWVTPVSSNGFVFSDITGQGSLGTASNLDGSSVDNGTVHLMDWVNGGNVSIVRMEASDSSLFDLFLFDFTSGYLNGGSIAGQLSVTGYDLSGSAVANIMFSSADYSNLSFTTLGVGNIFQELQYVTFEATGINNRVGYDNIVVNESSVAVSEPTSIALFGLGLAGISFSRKMKARVGRTYYATEL